MVASVPCSKKSPFMRPGAHVKVSFLNATSALITAFAALLAAAASFFKPQDHSVTQASYVELSKGLEKQEP